MRTSSRFAMAVHVLTLLAYKGGARVTSQYLAASINTHPVIVRRLLLALQKAQLVETRKGAGSGSRLSRPPEEINLAQVYRAVENEEPFQMPIRKPNSACPVGQTIEATLEGLFVSAKVALEGQLAQTTLADIVRMVKANSANLALVAA